jgi:hypothetical protein
MPSRYKGGIGPSNYESGGRTFESFRARHFAILYDTVRFRRRGSLRASGPDGLNVEFTRAGAPRAASNRITRPFCPWRRLRAVLRPNSLARNRCSRLAFATTRRAARRWRFDPARFQDGVASAARQTETRERGVRGTQRREQGRTGDVHV